MPQQLTSLACLGSTKRMMHERERESILRERRKETKDREEDISVGEREELLK